MDKEMGNLGSGAPFPAPPSSIRPSLIYFFSSFTCFQTPRDQSSLLLFLNLFSAHFALSPEGCIFYIMPCTQYWRLLQNLVRMLWGLRFFPNESFPESKYYEGGQIISNYNRQKTRELSQPTEPGKQPTEIFARKVMFFFFLKRSNHVSLQINVF